MTQSLHDPVKHFDTPKAEQEEDENDARVHIVDDFILMFFFLSALK